MGNGGRIWAWLVRPPHVQVSIFGGAVDAEVEDHENNSATFNNLALEVAFGRTRIFMF